MKSYLKRIYQIFRDNYDVLGRKSIPPTIMQYNPHLGFRKKEFFSNKETKEFEEKFVPLLLQGRKQVLLDLIELTIKDVQNFPQSSKSNKTYCLAFLNFLKYCISTDKKRAKSIVKEMAKTYQLDGNDELVNLMGGENKFIKKAIESSYFFSRECVEYRFNEIKNDYQAGNPIPARYKDRKVGTEPIEQCNYPKCDICKNGNAKLRSMIKRMTGVTVSAGFGTTFVNYKISHIWGNAIDPRYYSNLWNVVLVPAWANDLLDKPTAETGTLAAKMLNTYKAIINKLYNLQDIPLSDINLNYDETIKECQKDVVKLNGKIELNIIEKTNGECIDLKKQKFDW